VDCAGLDKERSRSLREIKRQQKFEKEIQEEIHGNDGKEVHEEVIIKRKGE
jgi:hypothetical protein